MLFRDIYFHIRASSTHCLHGPPITLAGFVGLKLNLLTLDKTKNRGCELLGLPSVSLTTCVMSLSICQSLLS